MTGNKIPFSVFDHRNFLFMNTVAVNFVGRLGVSKLNSIQYPHVVCVASAVLLYIPHEYAISCLFTHLRHLRYDFRVGGLVSNSRTERDDGSAERLVAFLFASRLATR